MAWADGRRDDGAVAPATAAPRTGPADPKASALPSTHPLPRVLDGEASLKEVLMIPPKENAEFVCAIEDQRRWVIYIDIGGIFDNLDDDLLMRGRPGDLPAD